MYLKVKHYTEFDKNKWDEFVYSSSMGWAYFLYEMIPFFRYSSYINKSFAIVDDEDNILMVMQLHLTPENTLLSQWGFVLKDNLTKRQTKLLKQLFQNYIDSIIIQNHIKLFSLCFPPLTEVNSPDKCDRLNIAMFYNFVPSLRYTCIVDLSKSDERMLADCEETTRQAIRKYEKSMRYSIIESSGSKEDCEAYINLHKETYIRTGNTQGILDDKYNQHIFEKLIPQKICRVFFLKDNETGDYVASVAILIYKNTAYYWWGASRNEKEIGINKYLLFKVICIIRESFGKSGYFETGEVYLYETSGKPKGLTDYKKCFGTFFHPIFTATYHMPCVPHKVINLLGIKIKYRDKKALMTCTKEN